MDVRNRAIRIARHAPREFALVMVVALVLGLASGVLAALLERDGG